MSIVFITGSSTGIGFSTAITLARSGHTVYASMRNPQKAPDLQRLASGENLPIHVVTMDVDDDASVKQGIGSVLEKEGFIDVLVNNAGIGIAAPVEEFRPDDFRSIMETNYHGAIRCIQAVLPSMRNRRSGCIINNSSIAAKVYLYFFSAYCASKAALEAFSECLAQEVVSHNIRIALVEPGVIQTAIHSATTSGPYYTHYPLVNRFYAFFQASLEQQVPASVVADVIKDIVEGRSTTFRNPAGPDASPLMGFRASLSDEDWINSVTIDDETWAENMAQMGLNVKPYL